MCAVNIDWEDRTGLRTQAGRLEDKSRSGAGISLNKSIPAGTKIKIREAKGELTGIVRYCRPEGYGYFLGVEFDGAISPEASAPKS
jgi:hypothetical protein